MDCGCCCWSGRTRKAARACQGWTISTRSFATGPPRSRGLPPGARSISDWHRHGCAGRLRQHRQRQLLQGARGAARDGAILQRGRGSRADGRPGRRRVVRLLEVAARRRSRCHRAHVECQRSSLYADWRRAFRLRGVFTPLKTDAWVPLSMQPQLRPGRRSGGCPLAVALRTDEAGHRASGSGSRAERADRRTMPETRPIPTLTGRYDRILRLSPHWPAVGCANRAFRVRRPPDGGRLAGPSDCERQRRVAAERPRPGALRASSRSGQRSAPGAGDSRRSS